MPEQKISEDQYDELIALYQTDMIMRDIGKHFGVCRSTVLRTINIIIKEQQDANE